MRVKQSLRWATVVVAATVVSFGAAPLAAQAAPAGAAKAAAIRDCVDVANYDVGRGDTGNYVREVQCLLNYALNPSVYGRVDVDGEFGPRTENQVKAFQRCMRGKGHTNVDVDGRVGSITAPLLQRWAAAAGYAC